MKSYKNFSIKKYNTFGLDVIVREFIVISSVSDLFNLKLDKDYYILGAGSNTVFSKDYYDGTVLFNGLKGIEIQDEGEKNVYINVKSGESWDSFVWYCCENEWCGVENLVSIPGTVGGAVYQNIGAFGVEISSVVKKVYFFDFKKGKIASLEAENCDFRYRGSIFKDKLGADAFIVEVVLCLDKLTDGYSFKLDYSGVREEVSKLGFDVKKLTPKQVAIAIDNIRKSRFPDLRVLCNAGCIFEHPIVSYNKYEELRRAYPDLIYTKYDNERIKLNAGWMIEKCGLKGYCIGDACVYEKHALFIVNKNNAKPSQLIELMLLIKECVYKKFGVQLKEEVVVV